MSLVGDTHTEGDTGAEPSGVQSGDVFVAIATNGGADATAGTIPTLATGWTNLDSAGSAGNHAFRTARIVRGGTAPSLQFANAARVVIIALRNYNSSGSFFAGHTEYTSSTTAFTAPALATITNPSTVISFALMHGSRSISSTPTGYTQFGSNGFQASGGSRDVSATSESSQAWVLASSATGYAVNVSVPVTLSATVTKDVTATTKISQVAGASVTVNTKLGLIHVKDVTATAKLAAVPHKDVAALAQVSHVQTKNLTGLTEISLGHTKDVTAAAHLSMAATFDLSAALLIQNVFTLPRRLPAGVARIVPVGRGVARVTRPPAGTARIIGRPTVGTARSKPPGGGSE